MGILRLRVRRLVAGSWRWCRVYRLAGPALACSRCRHGKGLMTIPHERTDILYTSRRGRSRLVQLGRRSPVLPLNGCRGACPDSHTHTKSSGWLGQAHTEPAVYRPGYPQGVRSCSRHQQGWRNRNRRSAQTHHSRCGVWWCLRLHQAWLGVGGSYRKRSAITVRRADDDRFGGTMAVSEDGGTVVVGADGKDAYRGIRRGLCIYQARGWEGGFHRSSHINSVQWRQR